MYPAGLCVLLLSWAAADTSAGANDAARSANAATRLLSLRASDAVTGFQEPNDAEAAGEYDLAGPYFLRSADPVPPGELELKFIYGFQNSADNSDQHEVEFELEWGIADDLEFILELPVTLAEGGVEGNGDIEELGFHIRHWRESGSRPAFATRHLIRVPTGYHSDGVDYLARGLFTKTLVPDTLRLHCNPYLKSVNGNLDDDTRRFQYGAAIGVDYRLSDTVLLIADYQYRSGAEEGVGGQHLVEFGADWTLGPNRKLGLQTEFEIDGDSHGTDFGLHISYIVTLETG